MKPLVSPEEELVEQYRRAGNLDKRVSLHARFSLNPYPWQRWIFDHLRLPERARILELGAGTGALWRENLERLPETWEVVLTDFSPGMLRQAAQNLAERPQPFTFRVADAQSLPFETKGFDAVIANHMLYHVPDRERAFAEIRRVLKIGGHFYASTVGEGHMYELWELAEDLAPGVHARSRATTANFTLENGLPQLERWFADVRLHRYEDALVVTEAEPLIAYVLSSQSFLDSVLDPDRQSAFRALVERRIAGEGRVRITKVSGLFSARRA
ncbi:MAG: class I SAM-dependent methyltransferase [Anaerolineales bacterium]